MDNFIDSVWANKFKFLGVFFLVFTLSYLVLVAIDFLPEAPETNSVPDSDESLVNSTNSDDDLEEISILPEVEEESVEVERAEIASLEDVKSESVTNENVNFATNSELPIAINIPKIGKNIQVLNPNSRNIADLDAALLDGVVRHPDSAALNQEGNVFILGHSSYLPRVFNQNFQAFNGIQNLAWGDKIEVYSEGMVHEYRVDKVYKANAQDTTVPIAGAGHKLTLATCNSFGSVDDRWIVESKRVSVRAI